MFKVLRNGLLRYILLTCPKLWCNPCSSLWCNPLDDHEWNRLAKESKLESSKMSLGVRLWKTKNLMLFFRLSVVKSSFPHSETPIFLLESWPCHTKYMCINIRAFQKHHKYHVSGSRTKNYKKKKRGTRKGAVSAGYLVFCSNDFATQKKTHAISLGLRIPSSKTYLLGWFLQPKISTLAPFFWDRYTPLPVVSGMNFSANTRSDFQRYQGA